MGQQGERLLGQLREQLSMSLQGLEAELAGHGPSSASPDCCRMLGLLMSDVHASIMEFDDAILQEQAGNGRSAPVASATAAELRGWLKQLQIFIMAVKRDLDQLGTDPHSLTDEWAGGWQEFAQLLRRQLAALVGGLERLGQGPQQDDVNGLLAAEERPDTLPDLSDGCHAHQPPAGPLAAAGGASAAAALSQAPGAASHSRALSSRPVASTARMSYKSYWSRKTAI